jgi:hypothetical protein
MAFCFRIEVGRLRSIVFAVALVVWEVYRTVRPIGEGGPANLDEGEVEKGPFTSAARCASVKSL